MSGETEPVFLLTLERDGAGPLHEQLERRLRERVRDGRLAPGTRLPSSRSLAGELGVSRGVVLEAYAQLVAEGYLTASQGAPTRVAMTAGSERPPLPASTLGARYSHDLDPCLPDVSGFPRARWLKSVRSSLVEVSFQELGQADPRGVSVLRDELMAYLGRARSAAPEPEHTLICSGFTQGFAIVCRTLRDRGVERIAVEDPGWVQHRLIAERAGLEPVAIRVDGEGLDVEALATSRCEVVVVTSAHQFPTGAVLSSERRAALLEWAEENDALIVEDDYDSELRYDRGAVGALQGLAPERVCNIGSFSKRLAPGLRLGWLLSPSWLTGALTYEIGVGAGASPVLEQLALADFIARGELDRHLRRMRLRYRARRDALVAAVLDRLPGAEVRGISAGLFVLVMTPEPALESPIVSGAAASGVRIEGLASHHADHPHGGRAGLVLGYANLPERAIERAVELVAGAVRGAARRSSISRRT